MKKLPKIYKSYSKKELRKALLKEMQCNKQIVEDNWNIVQENMRLQKELKIKQINETCTKTRNDYDVNFGCTINTNLPQKFSTKSIQDAIDSFEKIRGEKQ